MIDERETRVENPTEMLRGGDRLQGLDAHPVAPLSAPEPAPYVKEPFFSKRVMFGWALGTLIAWFALTVVVPAVVSSVVEAVRTSVASGPGGTTTIQTKRGVITITRDADGNITVNRQEPSTTTPAPSTAPAATAGPAPPAEPAEPRAPVEPTGKK